MNNSMIAAAVILLVLVVRVLLRRRNAHVNRNADPLAEAEVYLAYGRKHKAREILKTYLQANPGNAKAIELLNRVDA